MAGMKKIRPIDANALARKIREYMEDLPNAKTGLATCRAVLSMLGDEVQTPTLTGHSPDTTQLLPLTLEQLRGMDGQPVWIKDIRDRKWFNSGWAIVDVSNRLVREAKNWNPVFFGDYGEQWLAYAYPPAHIDREAWEPCRETCRNTCMSCDHNADELFGDADYCEDCHHYSKWESSVHKYCELCGRPKTPESWAELEKRLRG